MNSAQTLSSNRRPLVVGEVLFDEFEDGAEVLGGAPFNVAWHLQGFGIRPLLISRVGDDTQGRQVLDAMRHWGMDVRGIQLDPAHPTGRVQVRLRGVQPDFTILPEQAYDFIDTDAARRSLRGVAVALLYHGSLITRHTARVALQNLRENLAVPVFLDINLRAPWWQRAGVEALMRGVQWLKLNDAELAALLQRELLTQSETVRGASQLRAQCGCAWLIVTQGAVGAQLFGEREHYNATAAPVRKPVDSVGAGDAFSAVLILGICRDWPLPVSLRRAGEFAAAVCAQRGAIAQDRALYRGYQEQWQC